MNKVNYKYIIATLTAVLVLIMLILFLIYYFRRHEVMPSGPKLVIDHDGGADDAMAIFMALHYEKYFNGYPVIALTTTHGNVNETQAYFNTQKFLGIANREDIAIYRGCSSALIKSIPPDHYFGIDGLGDSETEFVDFELISAKPEHAAIALIDLSKKFEGELIVVTLGALTNIALATKLDPDFINRLSKLYVAAGHIHSEKFTEPEYNAAMDVESYFMVMKQSRPDIVTVIPFSQALLTHNICTEWRKNILGSIPTQTIRALNVFEQKSMVKSDTWCLLDPIAMAIVIDESQLVEETITAYNSINICKNRGITIVNTTKLEKTSRTIYKITEEPYKNLLLDIFSAELNEIN